MKRGGASCNQYASVCSATGDQPSTCVGFHPKINTGRGSSIFDAQISFVTASSRSSAQPQDWSGRSGGNRCRPHHLKFSVNIGRPDADIAVILDCHTNTRLGIGSYASGCKENITICSAACTFYNMSYGTWSVC